MEIPAFGSLLDIGNSHNITSILQCLIGYNSFTEFILFFAVQNEDENMFYHILKIFEKQIQSPCIVQPVKFMNYFEDKVCEDQLLDTTLDMFIKAMSIEHKSNRLSKVRISENIRRYLGVLKQLKKAESFELPSSNFQVLKSEYKKYRSLYRTEIIYTSVNCLWRDEQRSKSLKLMELFYGQFVDTTVCNECMYQQHDFETYNMIKQNKASKESVVFDTIMELVSDKEKVNTKCNNCGSIDSTKQRLVIRAPTILILSLMEGQKFTLETFVNLNTFTSITNSENGNLYKLQSFIIETNGVLTSYTQRNDKWYKYTTKTGNCIDLLSIEQLKHIQPKMIFYKYIE